MVGYLPFSSNHNVDLRELKGGFVPSQWDHMALVAIHKIKIELYLLVRSCSDIFPMDDAGFNCLLGEKEERSSSFISLILKNGSGKIFF